MNARFIIPESVHCNTVGIMNCAVRKPLLCTILRKWRNVATDLILSLFQVFEKFPFSKISFIQWIPLNLTEAWSRVDFSRWVLFKDHTKIFTSCLLICFLLNNNLGSLGFNLIFFICLIQKNIKKQTI